MGKASPSGVGQTAMLEPSEDAQPPQDSTNYGPSGYQEEIERLVGEYNRAGEHGKVYALDGKAVRGMRKKDEEGGVFVECL